MQTWKWLSWRKSLILTLPGNSRRGVPGSAESQREEGKTVGNRLYHVFHEKEEAKQSKQTQDWLVWIILAGSGARGLCPDIWYLALRWLGQENIDLECKSPKDRVKERKRALDWLAYGKHAQFTISRNWLAPGRAFSPGSVKPQMSKHQNKKTCLT